MNLFTIHGCRGMMPVSGSDFVKYGNHTTCFSLTTNEGLIVVDAGTGIISLSDRLLKDEALPPITIFFTHFHLDHVIGLPLFKPLYNPRAHITLMADPNREDDWKRSLKTLVGAPYWPVELKRCGATIRFKDLSSAKQDLPRARPSLECYGVRISWCPVWHPQQCLAYRLETHEGSIVIATDHEQGHPELDEPFLRFCRKADILIYDAQYTPEELASHRGWGHGTWIDGAHIAKEAQVRKLILTHHDRYRTDAQIDSIIEQARRVFPDTWAGREDMHLNEFDF